MEVFFNELSVKIASSEAEAQKWLESLVELGKLLKRGIESVSEFQAFRYSEDFLSLRITSNYTVFGFVREKYGMTDPITITLLSLFNSPYITKEDPQRDDFDYTSLTFAGEDHSVAGLAAAYLKNALAVSFDSDAIWDTCQYTARINRLTTDSEEVSVMATIEHASRKQHIIDCHLERLADLFDWKTYRPRFDCDAKTQTLLSLVDLYSLHVQTWKSFYHNLSQLDEKERVAVINIMAERIAVVQRWIPATGSLKNRNQNRTIYIIPNSNLVVSVDTQHGEFEVHSNQSGNNHLGAISFDGSRFKPAVGNRRLKI